MSAMEDKFNDSFKGFFSNNLITGFDFTLKEPLIYQREDGAIIANMDGVVIMPKDKHERLLKGEKE